MVTVWCRCGGSLRVRAEPSSSEERVAYVFAVFHEREGCELTRDPAVGLRWQRSARRREHRALVLAERNQDD